MLCSVALLVKDGRWQTVPDLSRKNPSMERSGPTLTLFCMQGRPLPRLEWHRRRTPLLLDCCWIYGRNCVCLYICGLRMCQCADTTSSHQLAGGRAVKEEQALQFLLSAFLGSCSGGGLAGRTCCCRCLSLGPAGDLMNSLLRSSLGCYVADCA